MMRSLYSGVAGLKTHQTKMDVIGNNIANVNTTAYKSQSVTFSELMYQTTQKASGANATTGVAGTNARQIGLGVKSGAINTAITSQGSAQTTNNPYDIMITGSAFFVVSNGNDTFFTRDGSFYIDGAGNLAMTSTGYNVMGWQVDEATNSIKQDTVSALKLMTEANMTYPPEATTKAMVSGILDMNDTNLSTSSGRSLTLEFYDNLGYKYTAKMSIHEGGEPGGYYVQLDDVLDSNGLTIGAENMAKVTFGNATLDVTVSEGYTPVNGNVTSDATTVTITDKGDPTITATFNTYDPLTDTGTTYKATELSDAQKASIKSLYGLDLAEEGITNFYFSPDGSMTVTGKTVTNAVNLVYSADNGKFVSVNGNGEGNMTMSFNGLGNFKNIDINFSETSMFNNNGTSTITAEKGDKDGLGTGRKIGEMSGITIQKDGMIYAAYDNGQTRLLGQIAVAEFANASGLEKAGDNLYSATLNSGEFDGTGVDITANGGYMTTGVLEMSNVDLSSEFTEMITTQRGFQANSRIITVSDTMLEELTNLKR